MVKNIVNIRGAKIGIGDHISMITPKVLEDLTVTVSVPLGPDRLLMCLPVTVAVSFLRGSNEQRKPERVYSNTASD